MLKRLYEPAAYSAASLSGCFWAETLPDGRDYAPLSGAARAEFAVIGAGFAGLSAALRLAEAGADVAVLDLHAPGWGASGRNGGFCCIGGAKASGATIARRHGAGELAAHRAAEKAAIALVEELAERYAIDLQRHSDGEVQLAHSPRAYAALREEAPEMARAYGVAAQLIAPEELATQGLAGRGFHGGLHLGLGFGLNPRALALGLAHGAQDLGVRIHANSPAEAITPAPEGYRIATPGGTLTARHLLIATNGYSAENLPGWMRARFLPVQSSVIVTRPLTEDEIAEQGWSSDLMAYDTRNLLHYFRLMPDRRMLFGMRGGVRWTPRAHAEIHRAIRADFEAMFPAWGGVETPYFWSGLANLARNLTPFVGAVPGMARAYAAFAWHGNGVAMGTFGGRAMADLALGRAPAIPRFYQAEPKRFELGPARRLALSLAYPYFKVIDAL
ncbi:hypothetical protein LPB142_07735 [Rhodobacter xanthinilyticus]|uniref:FAD dependent oxidoreductase domain-containing protein n=1 Tax=Rhodobacter xanthinilyticus TaxID=1850250 RepID=A0A1D9MBL9_9RHOB|nr:FAD-binding oxidoreductase [Rhodobacter xanthinilyticus]AOZ69221.1 hypothetical protein LPB142_07735 [Rhodobacter xanthinilyticus]